MSEKETATVIDFIDYFSDHISNFKPNFKAKLNKTYVFDQYLSNAFGQAVNSKSCHLLVPKQFHQMFANTIWTGAYYVQDKPGLYLSFKTKNNLDEHVTIAMRIFVRSKRIKAMSRFNSISISPYTEDSNSFDLAKSFELELQGTTTLPWEKKSCKI